MVAPSGLTADDATPGQATLDWSPTGDTFATGNDVYRGTTPATYGYLDSVVGRLTTTYLDSGLFAGGAITFESMATTVESSESSSITIAKPSGTAVDDRLLAVIAVDGHLPGVSTPTGWSKLFERENSNDNRVTMAVYQRVAGASEPTNHTFSWSSGTEKAVGGILRYDGVDTSSPIDAWATQTGSDSSPIAPSVTTTVDNVMVVRAFGSDHDDLPVTHPSGLRRPTHLSRLAEPLLERGRSLRLTLSSSRLADVRSCRTASSSPARWRAHSGRLRGERSRPGCSS